VQAALLTVQPAEGRGVVPGRAEEAPVGAAGAGAAYVRFQEHDIQAALAFGELVGGPQAGVSATRYAYV